MARSYKKSYKKKGKRNRNFGQNNVFAPVRNYKCSEQRFSKALENCSREIKDIELGKVIGSGSFGTIYSAIGEYKGEQIKLALKVIVGINLDEMNYEIEYSYYMSEIGLGPKIYDAFFFDGREEAAVLRRGVWRHHVIQILIMEPFDMSVSGAFNNIKDEKIIKDLVLQIGDILYSMIFKYNLECIDIKPGNFVYRKSDKAVRMIDFGADWCKFKKHYNRREKTTFYLMMLIQFFWLAVTTTNIDSKVLKQQFNTFIIPSGYGFIFKDREDYIDDMEKLLKVNNGVATMYGHYLNVHNSDGFHKLMDDINNLGT